jgi:hypothetical protein
MFESNPNFEAEVIQRLARQLDRAGDAAAAVLRENVSAGARSGRKYPRLPRRSSAPDEFLQEQFGDLKGAVKAQSQDELIRQVGIIDHPKLGDNALGALEFGNRAGTLAGRQSVTRTMEATTTHELMGAAIADDPQ